LDAVDQVKTDRLLKNCNVQGFEYFMWQKTKMNP
jgi:hypothetical protein